MRCLAIAAPLLLAGCIVASPAPASTTPPPGAEPEVRDHRGGEPTEQTADWIECHGNESIVLDSCTIDGPEAGIDAHGNCSVVLRGCTIRGGRVGIDAHGNASVVIEGGSIEGPVAIDAHGNASVVVDGALIAGEIERHGNASVDVR